MELKLNKKVNRSNDNSRSTVQSWFAEVTVAGPSMLFLKHGAIYERPITTEHRRTAVHQSYAGGTTIASCGPPFAGFCTY